MDLDTQNLRLPRLPICIRYCKGILTGCVPGASPLIHLQALTSFVVWETRPKPPY